MGAFATAYTPHPCTPAMDSTPQKRCEGIDCGDNHKGERYQGVCDKDGCDINPFRMGNQTFYGRGPQFAVNTLRPMTQVTQFLTTDGTDNGDLHEIRRFYVQDGRIIHSPPSTILPQNKNSDSITDEFCEAKKDLFGDVDDFQAKGGNPQMGKSLDRGQVLAISLWDDVEVNMLWLDSAYPLDKPITAPGVKRGNCPGGESSTPTYVRNNYPDAYVLFANAAIGEIGSTYNVPITTTQTPPATTQPTCELDNDMRACVAQGGSFECGRCTNDIIGEPCCSCQGSENPVTTTEATTTSSQPAGLCKPWCETNTNSWDKKCKWPKCAGCSPCSARRLRGNGAMLV